jgi:hypothetical protein
MSPPPHPTGTQLGLIDTSTSQLTPLATGYSSFGRLAVTGPGLADPKGSLTLVTVAGSASKAGAVVMLQVGGLSSTTADSAALHMQQCSVAAPTNLLAAAAVSKA